MKVRNITQILRIYEEILLDAKICYWNFITMYND